MKDELWAPVSLDEAQSLIGEGLHTGLRKGTEADGAHDLWVAINDSAGAWDDALAYCMWGLESMGYKLCASV